MVRVISVHHFVSQDIHTCEDPVAVTTAPPDYLLLALPQHVVEVRDLAKGGSIVFNFPTVDQVHQMLHCCNGNYVATLELKQNRQGKECTHARIYANWDSPCMVNQGAGCGTGASVQQPMRARIAGRVTPSSAQSGPPSLEMIELPLKRTPNVIACCQTTGNLLVASHKTLMLYHFHMRTHDISRLRFIDFEESGVCVELSFSPSWLSVAEDIIACMAQEYVHVFRLGSGPTDGWKNEGQWPERKAPDSSSAKETNTEAYINWDEVLKNCTKSKLHHNSFPVTVDLPSIVEERITCCHSSPSGVIQRLSPFQMAPPDMTIMVRCASPSATPWAAKNEVLHLLQLQMATTHVGSGTKQIYSSSSDEFRCLILKPMYVKAGTVRERKGSEGNPMHSKHYSELVSVICLVVTQQEGYLYHFRMQDLQDPSSLQQAACVTVYPFTAPVSSVVMERFVLHALTETGLETYTLRAGHHLMAALDPVNNVTSACPPVDDPVCLVGLRPFLGVEHLLLANSYLVLLACSEGSSSSSQDSHCGGAWTLYSLSLPSPAALYSDILSVGSAHRWSSPTTYCHLLCEGHIILRTALNTVFWTPGSSEALPSTFEQKEMTKLEELYRESCALLADYYVMSDNEEDWNMAAPYYRMAGFTPMEVVNRVRKIEIPPAVLAGRENQDSNSNLKGLMCYLHTCLMQLNQAPGDVLFNPAVPSFAHTLLDLFEEFDPAQVSTLVLHSSLLREYATDRVLGIMKKQLSIRAVPVAADALALVLLCIQRGSPEQAIAVLDSLSPDSLTKILIDNPSLLLEQQSPTQNFRGSSPHSVQKSSDSPPQYNKKGNSPNLRPSPSRGGENVPSFSELASILMDSKPGVLADVLADLVMVSQYATLQLILQVFLEYIPSRIGIAGSAASHVLQRFLEKYFAWYFNELTPQDSPASYDMATVEALKILVRSYLSDLQRFNLNSSAKIIDSDAALNSKNSGSLSDTKVLFESKRLAFLGKMPPYAADLSKRLVSLQDGVGSALENLKPVKSGANLSNDSLFKLQCLLCSGKLPRECLIEVHQFVQSHPHLHGNLSLQVLCVPTREATNILLDFCPQALLQYTKDRFTNETEWKCLLLLLHKKGQTLGDDSLLKTFYLQVTKDILTHLAQTLSLEELCRVLPPGGENMYRSYLQICQQVGHANHIRALIMATGQQLLSTLNL
ncbi:BLOC-2 complex member HPS3 isoform X2 [Periplaneta americana]|uniref:BLOC-2 complex member HPS3 isoform X2 n=1 Tax=Periplaneta americana TaxID=6978 RepID=UPI0037E8176B